MDKAQEELIIKFQMFEQQIEHLNSQLQAVEEGIAEMNSLGLSLNELIGKKGQEIFAPIGRGIFVRAKLESEELLVDVGEKNFVKRSISETKKIIEDQVKKLENIREELTDGLKKIDKELTDAMIKTKEKECDFNKDSCDCN
jgi:prefoldin alpha subunit